VPGFRQAEAPNVDGAKVTIVNASFLKPPGFDQFENAVCGGGWAFFWNTKHACATPGDGTWVNFCPAPQKLTTVIPTRHFMVAISPGFLGLWRFGEKDWTAWIPIRESALLPRMSIDGDLACVYTIHKKRACYDFYRIDEAGIEHTDRVSTREPGGLWCVWKCEDDGSAGVLGDQGVFRIHRRPIEGTVLLKKDPQPTIGMNMSSHGLYGPSAFTVGRRALVPHENAVMEVDLLGAEPPSWIHLGCPAGYRSFWQARARDDRNAVAQILTARRRLSRAGMEGAAVTRAYDVLLSDGIVIGFGTADGFLRVLEDGDDSPRIALADEQDPAVVTWRLWCWPDSETELTDAVRAALALQPRRNQSLLWLALGQTAEKRFFETLFRCIKENALGDNWSRVAEGIRQATSCIGAAGAPAVRAGLGKGSPGEMAAAAAAAGVPGLWASRNECPVRDLLRLVAHVDRIVGETAESSLSAIAEPVAEEIIESLDCPSSRRRLRLLKWLRRKSPRVQEVIRRVETLFLSDADPAVRRGALEALYAMYLSQDVLGLCIRGLIDDADIVKEAAIEKLIPRAEDFDEEHCAALGDMLVQHFLIQWKIGSSHPATFCQKAWRLSKTIQSSWAAALDKSDSCSRLMAVLTGIAIFSGRLLCSARSGFELSRSDLESASRFLVTRDRSILLREGEAESVADTGALPRDGCRIALRIAEIDPGLGNRLGVLALCAANEMFSSGGGQRGANSDRNMPLHRRLRRIAPEPDWLMRCEDLVRQQTTDPGLSGASALFALSCAGDAEAAEELAVRFIAGETGESLVLFPALARDLDGARREHYLRSLLGSAHWPSPRRLEVMDSCARLEMKPPRGSADALCEEIARDVTIAFNVRIEAATRLAEDGRNAVLLDEVLKQAEDWWHEPKVDRDRIRRVASSHTEGQAGPKP